MKCQICDGIKDSVKLLDKRELKDSIESILEVSPPGAYITTQESSQMAVLFDPLAFYIGLDEGTHLFYDQIAIALRKNFELKSVFNKL